MVDFKIKRGLSTTLFSAPGVINPRLVVEEGCWYLCTDTAELYLGVFVDNEVSTLKRINEVKAEVTSEKFQAAIKALNDEIARLEAFALYQKIDSEADLPSDYDSEDFNPNITYYIPLVNGKVSTYIFDSTAECYLCTNNVDELVVRAMVTEAIEDILEDALIARIPLVVKQTIENIVLHGGDATPEDDE